MPPIHTPSITTMMQEAHRIAVDKGWWPKPPAPSRNIPEALALIHSEISEALEEYRKTPELATLNLTTEAPLREYVDDGRVIRETLRKPEGFGVELADVAIRVFDLAQKLNIPLADLIWQKMLYNDQRQWRHEGKRA